MGMAAILFSSAESFELNVNILSTEGPRVKSGENCSGGFREDVSGFHDFTCTQPRGCVCVGGGGGGGGGEGKGG